MVLDLTERLATMEQQLLERQPAAAEDDPCLEAPFAYPCATSAEMKTPPKPFAQFDRVMAITAHPDDESLGSGTLAQFAALGKVHKTVPLIVFRSLH